MQACLVKLQNFIEADTGLQKYGRATMEWCRDQFVQAYQSKEAGSSRWGQGQTLIVSQLQTWLCMSLLYLMYICHPYLSSHMSFNLDALQLRFSKANNWSLLRITRTRAWCDAWFSCGGPSFMCSTLLVISHHNLWQSTISKWCCLSPCKWWSPIGRIHAL